MNIEQETKRMLYLDKRNQEPFAYEKWVWNQWKKKIKCLFDKQEIKERGEEK